ncbi:MAG TPA: hypothetical protein VFC78_07500 [Tepidisphaeraceae bacterium]|nr:hypothetical protein [Tepidisphaeraceae bacterium]
MHTIAHPGFPSQFPQRCDRSLLIGPRHHQFKSRIPRTHACESGNCQIAPFLGVNPGQEQDQPLAGELGECSKEGAAAFIGIVGRRLYPIPPFNLANLVQPKRFSRQNALVGRGEDYARRVAKNAIFSPGPVEPFLQMLQRVMPLEPRIQSPVNKNVVRQTPPQRAPCAKALILPYPMNDHRVEAPTIRPQPADQSGAVPIWHGAQFSKCGSKLDELHSGDRRKWNLIGGVKSDYGDNVTEGDERLGQVLQPGSRPTIFLIQRAYDV